MNKVLILASMASIFVITACRSTSEKDKQVQVAVNAEEHHDNHKEGFPKVVLNNGKKWQANPETSQGIENMIKRIDQDNAGKDPVMLRDSLKSEFQLIFKRCTMKGEAHVRLHNYLVPMNEQISKFDQYSDRANVDKLKDYLITFYEYFE